MVHPAIRRHSAISGEVGKSITIIITTFVRIYNHIRYMLLAAFDFLQMKIVDILDIILLGVIIFLAFRWLRGSSAMSIFVAIVSLYIIRVLVGAFDMRLMSAIMDMILDVGVLALIVIFQPEIRKALEQRFGSASIILISHRITTLSKADHVIVLDKGRIAEMGTPEELQNAGGLYQRIYEIQSLTKEEI